MEAAILGVSVVFLVLYFAILLMGLGSYILQALALYTIADRRQLPNPWMAWVPYANYWLIGGIVDDYEATRGIKRKWRVVLLVLALVVIASVMLMYVFLFVMMFSVMSEAFAYSMYDDAAIGSMFGKVMLVYAWMIPMVLASTALQSCYTICLYKVFESTVPEKAVKYLLLGLLVPMAMSICLFKCRKQGYERPRYWYVPAPQMPVPAPVPVPQVQPAAPEADESAAACAEESVRMEIEEESTTPETPSEEQVDLPEA